MILARLLEYELVATLVSAITIYFRFWVVEGVMWWCFDGLLCDEIDCFAVERATWLLDPYHIPLFQINCTGRWNTSISFEDMRLEVASIYNAAATPISVSANITRYNQWTWGIGKIDYSSPPRPWFFNSGQERPRKRTMRSMVRSKNRDHTSRDD